jgi:cytochrome c
MRDVVNFTGGDIVRKYNIPVAVLSFVAMVSVAYADTKGLAEEKQCFSCHSADKEMGKAPAFTAIAKKYKGVANAEVYLAQKIRDGGVGHWGPDAMPGAGARPLVSDSEAKQLVTWVLAQH